MKLFAHFAKCESGATAIEYGLIAALIGVAIIGKVIYIQYVEGAELVKNAQKQELKMNFCRLANEVFVTLDFNISQVLIQL